VGRENTVTSLYPLFPEKTGEEGVTIFIIMRCDMKTIIYTQILITLFVFSGCSIINGSSDESETGHYFEIVSFTWILESFEIDGAVINVPNNQIYTLAFLEEPVYSDFNSFNLKIQSDCNECWSNFQIFDNGAIAIDPLICTEIYCGDESLDGQFTFALQNVLKYETKNHWTLRIFYENGEDVQVLNFRRVVK
jgi:heat shock protein HslJ